MAYFISNIDNQIHNSCDIDNYIIIDGVINILDEDGHEIDSCCVYDTIGELMNAINSEQFVLSKDVVNTNDYVRCFDKFDEELEEGDIVDVQRNGEQKIYKKEDGQLYFKPYGKEDRVSAYFKNDILKVNN